MADRTEWTGAIPKGQPDRISEQESALKITGLFGVWPGILGKPNRFPFHRQKYADGFFMRPIDRSQPDYAILFWWQNNPIATPSSDQATWKVRLGICNH
jgi:hypothetical protein